MPTPSAVALALAVAPLAIAQVGPVRYTIDLSRAREQIVSVEMTLRGLTPDAAGLHSAVVRMPVWRPGLYLTLDQAGGIRSLSACSPDGAAIPAAKIDKASWRLDAGPQSAVTVRYELYANALDNRTRHATDTHAFLDPVTILLYADRWRALPHEVELILPPPSPARPTPWSVACGLEPQPAGEGRYRLVARDYDLLADSPIEAGILRRLPFDVDGVPHEICVWTGETSAAGPAPRTAEPEAVARWSALPADFSKLIRESRAIFGVLPYDRYLFIIHNYPGARGGTEHYNSCVMQSSDFLSKDRYPGFLHLVAHEFFHTWNIKRFRPAELAPYDYQRENLTTLLWVAEGTTTYYDGLLPVRAGLEPAQSLLDRLAKDIKTDETRRGSAVQSLADSSYDAWIKFNKKNADSPNSTVSFYDKGALASFALDMLLREHGPAGASLDAVMRSLFERFPAGGKGYSEADLRAAIAGVAGAPPDAPPPWLERFFAGTIHTPGSPDYDAALAVVGYELHRSPPPEDRKPKAYLGLSTADDPAGAKIVNVFSDSPANAADPGLIADDVIIALDDRRITSASLNAELDKRAPGETVTLTFFRQDHLRRITVSLADKPDVRYTIKPVKNPTQNQLAQRAAWLKLPDTGTPPNQGD